MLTDSEGQIGIFSVLVENDPLKECVVRTIQDMQSLSEVTCTTRAPCMLEHGCVAPTPHSGPPRVETFPGR